MITVHPLPTSISTRDEIYNNPCVHSLTKDTLIATENKDIIDRYYDILIVADILRKEMLEVLGE